MNFPTFKSIRTFEDVKSAFDSIRTYFSNLTSIGNVTITQPKNSATITISDGVTLSVKEEWELGKPYGGLSDLELDTTSFIEIKVKGRKYKIALLQ